METSYQTNLEAQLDELEMLQSMFPGDGEMVTEGEEEARLWLEEGGEV